MERPGDQPPTSSAPATVAELTNIDKAFPGVRALEGVSMDVRRGEVHALVGKNGAGKSTLMHILTGLYAPDAGTLRIGDTVHDRLTTAQAKEAGIALVAQHARFVPGLSVAENIFCGDMPVRAGGFIDWQRIHREAAERLSAMGLDLDVRRHMESVSVAERQMIEIAKALFARASLIILDEPTAPLPKHEVRTLFDFVRRQRQAGASFIYISHYLEEIFEVADRATVLRNGRVVGVADVSDITQADLIRMISGTTVERFRRDAGLAGETVLSIRGLSRPGAYSDVDLDLHSGEIVGITGLEGSGPGALARALFGLEPLGDGTVTVDGSPLDAVTPKQALARGVAYLPRDRHGLGIVGVRSVRDNISLSVLKTLEPLFGLIDGRRERALVQDFIEKLAIVTPSMSAAVETLSGGNQQKVVVAKLTATEPRVLLLDEPTQGVDVQAKVEILRIVDRLAAQGVAIAVISDELSELMDICDRIVVFHRGRVRREFRKGVDRISSEVLLDAIEGGGAVETLNDVA